MKIVAWGRVRSARFCVKEWRQSAESLRKMEQKTGLWNSKHFIPSPHGLNIHLTDLLFVCSQWNIRKPASVHCYTVYSSAPGILHSTVVYGAFIFNFKRSLASLKEIHLEQYKREKFLELYRKKQDISSQTYTVKV
jgi:hypothetical protein